MQLQVNDNGGVADVSDGDSFVLTDGVTTITFILNDPVIGTDPMADSVTAVINYDAADTPDGLAGRIASAISLMFPELVPQTPGGALVDIQGITSAFSLTQTGSLTRFGPIVDGCQYAWAT